MGFLARIVQILLWLVLATWVVRKLFRALAPHASREVRPAALVPKPLHRDPWCGTHVSAEISFQLKQAGKVVHFCSAECRERYQASLRQAASG